ncbi:putative CENPB DNA-binding domain-containing protein 1 [Rhynchonycteris naso]
MADLINEPRFSSLSPATINSVIAVLTRSSQPGAVNGLSEQPAKKGRKAIDLHTKMEVIKQDEGGKKVNVIARDMKLSHLTVSTILKDEERIHEAVKGSAPMRSTVLTKHRSGPIHKMEKLLYIWMEDQIQKRTPLSLFTVQRKARSLFHTLKERAGEDDSQEFVAIGLKDYSLAVLNCHTLGSLLKEENRPAELISDTASSKTIIYRTHFTLRLSEGRKSC